MPIMCIFSCASRISDSGQVLPAMMPVRIWEKSVLAKSGCSSMPMNMVGTPLKTVIFSWLTHASEDLAEKYGIGHSVAP